MRRVVRLTLGIVLLLLTAVFSKDGVLGAGQNRTLRNAPPLTGRLADMPMRFDLERDGGAPAADEAASALLPWSRMVFSSARNDNWEIYIANDDGSNEKRLTNHPAADTNPALDRGGQRLAFSSNRDGDDEIYVMKSDGTGLQQLTANTSNDYNPAWSPDGSKIAFQSFRNGQSEVYVMHADGSQQTRLTTNAAYDGIPEWSPDGQKIAFTSNRGGGWRIWVMDANGQNQVQLSQQAYSEDPVWSPDGSKIAYDADGDNDGWLELWLMDANGGNQREIYDPGYPYDAWASSWSPNGEYVAFTRAEWFYYNNTWYWVAAELYRWKLPSGGIVRMHPGDVEMEAHWQTLDATPPVANVAPLPAYLRDDAQVFWHGLDSGGAGIRFFDVQYRVNNGAWTNWQTNHPPDGNTAVYPHQPGNTVYFRARAVDNAYNMEAWPSGDGDTATTFYSWAIEGSAYDNRGTALHGVSTTGANVFEIWPSDENGNYRYYYACYDYQCQTFEVVWEKGGYLELHPTYFKTNQDAQYDVVMPPSDNVVQEWGFESGQLPSGGWSVSGSFTPTITTTQRHTGNFAAFLGLPEGYVPPTITSEGADVAVDRQEKAYAMAQAGNDVWSGEAARAADTGDPTISQEVVVPAAATNPTLSFLYLLDGGGEDGGYLEVQATVGVTTTTIYSTTTTTAGWTHQWVDMSPWAGQTITLSLAVGQGAGAINTAAYVDEITLGAAYPDTWVTLEAPGGIAPGKTMTLTIDYGNRGGVAAAGGEVTLALPPELSFVSADPGPITTTPVLTWDIGQLAAGNEGVITVTVQMASNAVVGDLLSLLATLTSTTDELELFNNTFDGAVRVGDLTYLPTVKAK